MRYHLRSNCITTVRTYIPLHSSESASIWDHHHLRVCSLIFSQAQLAELREQLLVANARASSASDEAMQQLGVRIETLSAEGHDLRAQLAEAEAAKTRALDDCRSSERQVRTTV